MKKIWLCLVSLIILFGCNQTDVQSTIDPLLFETPYSLKQIHLENNNTGLAVVSKVYDTTNHVEKGEITFYVQGIKAHEEILLSWSENYLIQKDCTDADCLRYLFYEVFQIEEDEYLNETIDLFNQYQEVVDLFITQRQELSNYDGFIQITIRDEKEVQKYHASTISIGQGKNDDLVIQSQVYILNLK